MEDKPILSTKQHASPALNRSRLTASQIEMIEEAIAVIGEFGEVHLVVDRGRLHYITAQKSFNAHNYSPGMIVAEFEGKGG